MPLFELRTLLFLFSVDPFARKEWYDVKVPTVFTKNVMGKTFVNKSAGISLIVLIIFFNVSNLIYCFLL